MGDSVTSYHRLLKGFSFLSLLVGAIAILAVILTRAFGLFKWIKFYHQALSLHAISMLVFWAPLAMLFFLESKRLETARNLKNQPWAESFGLGIRLGSVLVVLGIAGSWITFFTNPEIRLTQFILTPNSLPICSFLLVYILGLLVLFTTTGQRLSIILRARRKESSSREWVRHSELIFSISICIMMAINALLTGGFFAQGLLFSEWQSLIWLPLGHLSLQSMTLATMMIWDTSFGRNPIRNRNQEPKETPPWQAKFKFICFAGYPIFCFLGVLHVLPLFYRTEPSNLWQDQFIWIPALSTLGLTLLFAIQPLRYRTVEKELVSSHDRYIPRRSLSETVWRLSFLAASLFGGVSGLLIGGDKIIKAKVLGTLFMPGHFHPLVLGGVTLTFLGYFISKQEPYGERMRRSMRFLVISLIVSLSLLSGVLMTSGWLWRSARRFPALMGMWPGVQNAFIAVFGLVTALSLILIIVLIFVQKDQPDF